MSRRRHRLAATLLLGLATAQLACATGAERMAKGGAQGGIEGTLEAFNDPKNQQLVRQLLADANVQRAAHDLTASITGGALDGLTEAERMERVRTATDAYVQAVSATVGRALNEDISPALTSTVEHVVGGAVAAALRPENRERARSFIDGVTRGMVSAALESSARGLRDDLGPALNQVMTRDLGPALNQVIAQDLGPALQQLIEHNLGPALRKVIDHDLKPALQDALGSVDPNAITTLSRHISREIVLGIDDGMRELGLSVSPRSQTGIGWLGWLAIALGLILVIFIVLLVRTILTRRALTQERQRSERMLLDVLYTMQTDDNGDSTRDLDSIIARACKYDAELDTNDAYLASIIARARQARGDTQPAAKPQPPSKPRK